MPEYNKDLMIKVLKEHHETKTNAEIAKILKTEHFKDFGNRAVDSIRKRVSELRTNLGLTPPKPKEKKPKAEKIKVEKEDVVGMVKIIDSDLEIDKSEWMKNQSDKLKLQEEMRKTRSQEKIYISEIETLSQKLNILQGVDEITKRKWEITAPKKNGTQSEATAFMVGSDWHYEERVDPEKVNNMNEYNPSIAKDSIFNFFRVGARLRNVYNKDISINHIVIPLLGDLITGYIHEDLVESNYMSPIEAINDLEEIIFSGIEHVLKETNCRLTIPCKFGNHGRTTPDKRISTAWENSFEVLMYRHLARMYKDHDRVQFIVEKGYLTYLTLYDKYLIRMHHGDYIKYNGGIGGITIPTIKAIAGWDRGTDAAYLDVFGHYHQQMTDTGSSKFVLNGSIIGYNSYSLSLKASYEEPKQAFFLIDKHRGKTISAPIFVRKKEQ
jgi:hypothetical protein